MGHEFSQSVAIFSTKFYGITLYWSGTKETLLNSITKEWKTKFTDFFMWHLTFGELTHISESISKSFFNNFLQVPEYDRLI